MAPVKFQNKTRVLLKSSLLNVKKRNLLTFEDNFFRVKKISFIFLFPPLAREVKKTSSGSSAHAQRPDLLFPCPANFYCFLGKHALILGQHSYSWKRETQDVLTEISSAI